MHKWRLTRATLANKKAVNIHHCNLSFSVFFFFFLLQNTQMTNKQNIFFFFCFEKRSRWRWGWRRRNISYISIQFYTGDSNTTTTTKMKIIATAYKMHPNGCINTKAYMFLSLLSNVFLSKLQNEKSYILLSVCIVHINIFKNIISTQLNIEVNRKMHLVFQIKKSKRENNTKK